MFLYRQNDFQLRELFPAELPDEPVHPLFDPDFDVRVEQGI